jgi:hypothetical protein
MKVVALAVLVLALLPQHPRQDTQQVKQQSNGSKKVSSAPAAMPKAPATPKTADTDSADKSAARNDEPIRVAQPIAITTKPDYATWIFSALLVGVGTFQAYLLFGTMRAIQRQADEMQQQRVLMHGQLTAMQGASAQTDKLIEHAENQVRALIDSAKAASDSITFLKRKERARFFVVPFDLHGMQATPTGFYGDEYGRATVQLTHVGPTDAFNVVGQIKAVVQLPGDPLPEMLEMVDVGLPTVIKSGHKPVKLSARIPVDDREKADALKEGKTTLHFFGVVTYEDVFGETHATRFRYVWRPHFYKMALLDESDTVEGSSSRWETCGPAEDNQAT